ncbi:MAG: hypothetical protein K2G55_21705 [Lachnospiraceae bacterium]|nr:hypothetical protein [Lachnospiraceae bacterium]MDE7202600.1 hypothetical protein [Lachnospiraceae bacterium]
MLTITEKNIKAIDEIVEVLVKEEFSIFDAEEILSEASKSINKYSPVQRVNYQELYKDAIEYAEEESRKDKKVVILRIESVDCLTQHMQAFFNQSGEDREADFGEPCANCAYAESCDFDWYGKMQPLFRQSSVGFSPVLHHSQK